MNDLFSPVGNFKDTLLLKELRNLEPKQFIPRLIKLWVGSTYNRTLRFAGYSAENKSNPVMIVLEQDGKPAAMARLNRAEIKALSPNYSPIPEETHDFADQEGFHVDQSWFDARNSRLKIKFSERLDEFETTAAALAELITSYALSSCGDAQISRALVEDYKNRAVSVYLLNLQFYGGPKAQGWQERQVLRMEKLDSFLEK